MALTRNHLVRLGQVWRKMEEGNETEVAAEVVVSADLSVSAKTSVRGSLTRPTLVPEGAHVPFPLTQVPKIAPMNGSVLFFRMMRALDSTNAHFLRRGIHPPARAGRVHLARVCDIFEPVGPLCVCPNAAPSSLGGWRGGVGGAASRAVLIDQELCREVNFPATGEVRHPPPLPPPPDPIPFPLSTYPLPERCAISSPTSLPEPQAPLFCADLSHTRETRQEAQNPIPIPNTPDSSTPSCLSRHLAGPCTRPRSCLPTRKPRLALFSLSRSQTGFSAASSIHKSCCNYLYASGPVPWMYWTFAL